MIASTVALYVAVWVMWHHAPVRGRSHVIAAKGVRDGVVTAEKATGSHARYMLEHIRILLILRSMKMSNISLTLTCRVKVP